MAVSRIIYTDSEGNKQTYIGDPRWFRKPKRSLPSKSSKSKKKIYANEYKGSGTNPDSKYYKKKESTHPDAKYYKKKKSTHPDAKYYE